MSYTSRALNRLRKLCAITFLRNREKNAACLSYTRNHHFALMERLEPRVMLSVTPGDIPDIPEIGDHFEDPGDPSDIGNPSDLGYIGDISDIGDPGGPEAIGDPNDIGNIPGYDHSVYIPDQNLLHTINAALGKPLNSIVTEGEMALLQILDASNKGISNLEGMQYAINMVAADFSNNNITDPGYISGMRNLQVLDLSNNFINFIDDMVYNPQTGFGTLPNLEQLNLSNNLLSNVDMLWYAPQLKKLSLENNNVSNIYWFKDLTNLEVLDLDYNKITSVTSLRNLTKLNYVDLKANNITDISALEQNTGLQNGDTVDVQQNPLTLKTKNQAVIPLYIRGVNIYFTKKFVSIPDTNLKNALNDALSDPQGSPIAEIDLLRLTNFDASGRNITSISGLQDCLNLLTLDLSDNNISSISPLASCTEITDLNISDNNISSITPVAKMTNLETINASGNRISSLTALQRLTKIAQINLNDNLVKDIAPLVNNKNINAGDTVLLLDNVLSEKTRLYQIPSLMDRNVNVEYSPIVVNIPDVNLLNAIDAQLGLAPGTPVMDTQLMGMDALDASGAGIVDLEGLQYALNLLTLDLSGNNISDISELSDMIRMVTLNLRDNNISKIRALTGMAVIGSLDLGENLLTAASDVKGLTSLTKLYLDGNHISNISFLANLTNLTTLNLKYNDISNVTYIKNLLKLNTLNLSYNRISDLKALIQNTGLGAGDNIDLRYNSLTKATIDNEVQALDDRGANVLFTNYCMAAGKFSFMDLDGDIVSMRGSGQGQIYAIFNDWSTNDAGEYQPVTVTLLTGYTSAKSNLNITVKKDRNNPDADGRVTLTNVDIDSDIKSINGKTVDINGLFNVDGKAGRITLGNVTGVISLATDVDTNIGTKDYASLTLGRLEDVAIQTNDLPVRTVTITDWQDTDAEADYIQSLWIGSFNVKGGKNPDRSIIDADMTADILLDGFDTRGNALGRFSVKGIFEGNITAAQVAMGVDDVRGVIGGITVGQWETGQLTAGAVKNFSTRADKKRLGEVDGNVGVDFTLDSTGLDQFRVKDAVTNARIAGNVTGDWNIVGNVRTIRITGLSDVFDLNVDGMVSSLTTGQWNTGSLTADAVKSLQTRANKRVDGIDGDLSIDITLSGENLEANRLRDALGATRIAGDASGTWNIGNSVKSVAVTGAAENLELNACGAIGGLTFGGLFDSTITACNDADIYQAIGTVNIKGWRYDKKAGPAPVFFENSNFFASGFKKATICDCNPAAQIAEPIFATPTGDGLLNLTYKDLNDKANNFNWREGRDWPENAPEKDTVIGPIV